MLNSKIEDIKRVITEADALLIGAGAGLSTSGGLEYSGKRFSDNFSDFIKEYGLTDMYSSAFYPFNTLEEKWAYFSRHIKLNRFDAPVGQVYKDLLQLVKDKDYFVLTTNGDYQFYRAGFEADRIFDTQGNYAKFQCSVPCHNVLYDNKEIVEKMVRLQSNFRIPTELLPTCPKCGEPMVVNLRMDSSFVEDENWDESNVKYVNFVNKTRRKKLVLLELGVGFNTPGIIRYPFEKMVTDNEQTTLIRLNRDNGEFYFDISEKSILIEKDIGEVLSRLLGL